MLDKDIQKLVDQLVEGYRPEKVILFGSFVTGHTHEMESYFASSPTLLRGLQEIRTYFLASPTPIFNPAKRRQTSLSKKCLQEL